MLPKMNAATINKVKLREYVSLLGLTFFIGYFEGVSDHCHWFSKEPITMKISSLKCDKCRSGGTTTMPKNTHQAITIALMSL